MKFLEYKWGPDAGHFKAYDKETKETTAPYSLKEFSVTNISYTVKGWDETPTPNSPNGSNIYSNDIKNFKEEDFSVKSGNGTLYEGKYNKEKIKALGANLHIQIEGKANGEDITIYLKGTNYFNFNQLLKELDTSETMIKLDGFTDEQNGAVKYRAPVFVKWGEVKAEITAEDVPF